MFERKQQTPRAIAESQPLSVRLSSLLLLQSDICQKKYDKWTKARKTPVQ